MFDEWGTLGQAENTGFLDFTKNIVFLTGMVKEYRRGGLICGVLN